MTHNHIIFIKPSSHKYVQLCTRTFDECTLKNILSSLKNKFARWIADAYFYINAVPKRNYSVNLYYLLYDIFYRTKKKIVFQI